MAQSTLQADVVVLGAGPAGYVSAIRLAQLGKQVTVIDRDELGGVCLNRGCIPSKALIYAGGIYEKIRHGEEFGIEVEGKVTLNLKKLQVWKEGVVKKLTGGVGQLLKANGCNVVKGDARFVDVHTLEVKMATGETVLLKFNQCVIATGSRPSQIRGMEVDHETVLDSTSALAQQTLPKTLLCIGGGYIGLELGTFYSKVGSKVTVVEAGPQLLGIVDPELVRVVHRKLEKNGVVVKTKATVKSIVKSKSGAEVTYGVDGKEVVESFEKVLVTIGRTPNTDGINLSAAGIKLDDRGFISVDAHRRTNVPHIYAIGDVAGQPLLAHKGSKEGVIAAEHIAGMKSAYDVVAMPAVVFVDPEIATVGMSESEAKAAGFEVMTGSFPMAANGRALSVGEPDGLVKVVGDRTSGKLLGVHIVGVEASNLIAEAALALEMGAQVEDLALTVHAHPTLPETLMEAAEATLGHAIHIFQKKKH